MTAPTTLDSKAVAEALGITAKELRVYLRTGKAEGMFTRDGKSYVFTKANVAKLKKGYASYIAEREASRAARAEAKAIAAEEARQAELAAQSADATVIETRNVGDAVVETITLDE